MLYRILLSLSALWALGHCQTNIYMLTQNLRNEDPAAVNQSLIFNKASKAIEELWTIYLPKVLNDNENTSNGSTVSQLCINSTISIILESLLPNISMPEIVPLLDATGKLGAGVLSGNFHLVPAFDQCFQYNYTSFCSGSIRFAFLPPTSPIVFSVGLCVPKYCNSADVTTVIKSTNILEVDDMKCTDRKRLAYTPGAIIMIVVCAIFLSLIAMGTSVDRIQEWTASETRKIEKVNNNGTDNGTTSAVTASTTTSTDKSPLLVKRTVTVMRVPCSSSSRMNLEFITAFSLYKTVPTLFATKQAPGVITCLNGLRVISMFWVILGHTYDFVLLQVDNTPSFPDIVSRFTFQPIINGNLSVDTFFFLSGVLVTYLTLRQMKKKGRFPFIHYYLHRYLRLTPIYAFVLFFSWNLMFYFATGPAFAFQTPDACSNYWWTNLLYINNFHPWKLKDECAGWTWYLANDMQFYIIAPLVVIPLYYLYPVGLVVASSFLLSGFIVTATLSAVYGFSANNMDQDTIGQYNDLIYIKPWGRISPYLVGLVFGYAIFRQIRFKFGRITNILLYTAVWIASGVILMCTLYGLYFSFNDHVLSRAENAIYITLSRFSWGVGLALLVFACHNGYGGLIDTFLSLKIWTPLSRMTLNAYLFHPVVIFVVYGQLQTIVHLTDITMSVYALAFVVLSYASAAVFCICIEFPLGTIEILLFKLIGIGGRDSQRQGTRTSVSKEKGENIMTDETKIASQKEA